MPNTITLNRAAEHVEQLTGWKPAVSTVWKWATNGLEIDGERHHLAITRVGGRVLTTARDIERFLEATGSTAQPTG